MFNNFLRLVLVGLMVSSAWVFYTSLNLEGDLDQFSDNYVSQLQTSIKDATRNFILPAKNISKLGSEFYENGTLDINNLPSLSNFIQPFINTYPQFNGYFIGNEEGEFWFWHNTYAEDYAFRVQTVVLNKHNELIEQKVFLDIEQNELRRSTPMISPYDPRNRLWYEGAKAVGGNFWSDVYSFNSDVNLVIPGITASFPIYDEENYLRGVWGVDIVLEELSSFLSDVGAEKASELVIFNDTHKVIAYSKFNSLELADKLISLSDLGNPIIEQAMSSYQQHGFNEFYFTVSGKRYLASYSSFLFGEEQDWSLLLVIPESKLIESLARKFNLIAIYSFIVFVISLLRLIFLIRQPFSRYFKFFAGK